MSVDWQNLIGATATCLVVGLVVGISARATPDVQPASPGHRGTARTITTLDRQNVHQTGVVAATGGARELLDRYCVGCHNQRTRTAGLALDTIDLTRIGEDAAIWEKVLAKLRSGAMPPAGRPRPDAPSIITIAQQLEESLDRAAEANPQPGRVAPHRLNRVEYTNAIRDLFGIDIDGRALLPADDSGYGFDNIADVLSLSPSLLERYLSASWQVSRLALGDPSIRAENKVYTVSPTYLQTDRASEELPFGSRGGMAVRHYFPVDAQYVFRIRMQRTHTDVVRGVADRNQVELRLDKGLASTFTVGGDGPLGEWKAVADTTPYELTADDHLEFRMRVSAGDHLVGVDLVPLARMDEGVLEPRLAVATYEYAGDRDVPMAVQSLQVTGPFDPEVRSDSPGRRRIILCQPERPDREEACAGRIFSTLARRAFRRRINADDLNALMRAYRDGRAAADFDNGIRVGIRALLVDPNFLFRVEADRRDLAPGTAYHLGQFELASRLSFFLWSSIPDDRLLDLAEAGALSTRSVLTGEVVRMLDDPRADSLIGSFAGQWLYLRNLRTISPDPVAFPDFDENLRQAMQQETELFLREQLRANHRITELVTADYSFLNERLAKHYGIPGVYGSRFRRVTFADGRRGGLLTQGSILAVTSYANRTSPTLRGKWLLENLLAAPPPAPPPNIPALPEPEDGGGRQRSVRERLEEHRRNAICASCHAPMDPIGLALEQFDAIGKWRTADGTATIDATASLPDGSVLAGADGVKRLLMTRKDRLVEAVAEKLLTYALGRGLEFTDGPAVRRIARAAAADDDRWRALLVGVVTSTPFQMRRSIQP